MQRNFGILCVTKSELQWVDNRTNTEDDERLTLTFAAVSTTVDDMIRTAALPDVDDERRCQAATEHLHQGRSAFALAPLYCWRSCLSNDAPPNRAVCRYSSPRANWGITIGQVIGIYCKSGSKNGKHGSVDDCTTIGAVSYVAVQVLEHVHGKQFLSIPSATSRFGPKQFALLPSTAFLSNLDHQPKVQGSVQIIKDIDVPLFRAIQTALKLFGDAAKLFSKVAESSGCSCRVVGFLSSNKHKVPAA
ncbi:hypothetical protein A0H81_06550 [Grifola frondosa]|uniref:Uncharacterized protein n=1 Tax=Grifola frondosa TaxID=5627 RepID=A0A1C7MAN9_GRIFR|nr:hypothetical protein A0H81_06550 [Grifola frondosa]